MSYIKTKDGVYEELDTTEQGVWTIYGNFIENNEILNQSETLEELCDEFVKIWNNTNLLPELLEYDEQYEEEKENMKYVYPKGNIIIYGAIWTDKGLIYVAKMDNEGKLVLI